MKKYVMNIVISFLILAGINSTAYAADENINVIDDEFKSALIALNVIPEPYRTSSDTEIITYDYLDSLSDSSMDISGSFPNPTNGEINFDIYLPQNEAIVSIELYDAQGAEVAVLFNSRLEGGKSKLTFNVRDMRLASGLYFCRFTTESGINATRKISVLRK